MNEMQGICPPCPSGLPPQPGQHRGSCLSFCLCLMLQLLRWARADSRTEEELLLSLFLALVLPPKNNLFLLAVVLLNDNPLPPLTTTDAMAPAVACMCVSFSFFPGFSIRSLLRGGKEGGKCTARGESVSSFILGARAIFFQLQETRSSHHSVQAGK